jgi:hypothetical protein
VNVGHRIRRKALRKHRTVQSGNIQGTFSER